MHIKLINPRMNCRPSDARLKFRLLPPQSLLLLGGLTPAEHEVTIVDENVERDARVDDSPDLVGIPVFVATARRAYRLADAYRSRGVPVVLGGLHASLCPEEAKRHADSVVVGEADALWPLLLRDLQAGRLLPFYRNEQAVVLSHSPFLRRDLVFSRRYASVAAMRTGRGCPNRCAYCYQSAFYPTPGLRHRGADRPTFSAGWGSWSRCSRCSPTS